MDGSVLGSVLGVVLGVVIGSADEWEGSSSREVIDRFSSAFA
jgi:hypothetical protein